MPLETATYLPDLNASNPAHTDQLNQADAHIRLLKSALKSTFPNFTDVALSATQAQIDAAVAFVVNGVLRGNGAVATGSLHAFPIFSAPAGYLRCNGAIYNVVDYPYLAGYLGNTFGGNGTTTFGVPNLEDNAGRYLRCHSTTYSAGSKLANTLKIHSHSATSSTDVQGAHGHNISVSVNDPWHTHNLGALFTGTATAAVSPGGGLGSVPKDTVQNNGTGASPTGISVTASADIQGAHAHNVSTSIANAGDASETRPETFVVYYAIKT